MATPPTIGPVSPGTPELESVFRLYRSHSRTLGFLPRGAFEQAATEGRLLAARIRTALAGYLAYNRVGANSIVVVHLCVSPRHRGIGVARSLMDALVDSTSGVSSIRLSCREDYEANAVWPRLGFICYGERRGRSHAGAQLFLWVRRCGADPPLLEQIQKASLSAPRTAVLDANVCFDLHSEVPRSQESHALLADWLQPEINLCVTGELWNEITRAPDPVVRQIRRRQAAAFQKLEGSPGAVEAAYIQIADLLPPPRTQADDSDRRHLAHAVATRADFFVTRDKLLLDHADPLAAALEINVLRPADLVVQLHAQQHPFRYTPARLVGTPLIDRLARDEADLLPFQQFGSREPKGLWLAKIRRALSDPHRFETRIIAPSPDEPRVLYGLDRSDPSALQIVLLRTLSHPLTRTLIRRVLAESLVHAALEKRTAVVALDIVDPLAEEALREQDFQPTTAGYAKLVLPIISTSSDLPRWVLQHASPLASEIAATIPTTSTAGLERLFWPLKVIDSTQPCYVLPIRAHWASQLFDADLASHDLFGAKTDVSLALENVYYSASPIEIPAGSRILWYISRGGRSAVREIRACSHALGTVRGPARRIFPQFSRLGIYRWPDVLRAARADPMSPVTAYRFDYTERLPMPIRWTRLQELIRHHTGRPNPIAGPTRIDHDLFLDLYSEATGRHV